MRPEKDASILGRSIVGCSFQCVHFTFLQFCHSSIICYAPRSQNGISHKLVQYQFMGWMENNFPRVPDFVKFVCDVLNGVRNMKENKKMLMHDT